MVFAVLGRKGIEVSTVTPRCDTADRPGKTRENAFISPGDFRKTKSFVIGTRIWTYSRQKVVAPVRYFALRGLLIVWEQENVRVTHQAAGDGAPGGVLHIR